MESLVWGARTIDSFLFASPLMFSLMLCLAVFNWDYIALAVRAAYRWVTGGNDGFVPQDFGTRPSALVIIPSLLRDQSDLDAFTTTIESCATNDYPGELTIIASVDGLTEKPALLTELKTWIASRVYSQHVAVHVSGTQTRLGKMMAVEAGVDFMKQKVARGDAAAFPTLYFSCDGDGTLGPHALERLAHRLHKPHPITGNKRRVVAGKICIRPDLVWRGWRAFFTVSGQIYANVAREFLVSNVARHNWRPLPKIGIPGALYCTWSEIIVQAPRYMGFMQSIKGTDWLRWMVGGKPPRFSEYTGRAMPEALTGASDDTCIAFIASITTWKNGKLDFDAPASPLRALGRILYGYIFERSHDYEPEARVYTYTPSTIKGLWTQRVRWNSSRVECAGRLFRAFWFHWEIGLPSASEMLLLLNTVFTIGLYYFLLPYACATSARAMLAFVTGYLGQTIAYTAYTVLALALEPPSERRNYWPALLVLPLASFYLIAINCAGCVVGVTKDIFLFGNSTAFAPEWTLRNGNTERIAILFRVRRFFSLALRSVLSGDVPLGKFWFGWGATQWTPSGYDGWTTKKAPMATVVWPAWTRTISTTIGDSMSSLGASLDRRNLATAGALLFLVLGATSCLPLADARPSALVTPVDKLRVTSGVVLPLDRHGWRLNGEVRAQAEGEHGAGADLLLTYRGPSTSQIALRSGEMRRQLGVKLRAKDTCNVVYVMWHVEPSPGIFVSVKHNPGQSTHEECGDHGYINVRPEHAKMPTPLRPDEPRAMRAWIEGAHLFVSVDGELAWQGTLPAATWTFDGPVGLRADNGVFDVTLQAL